MLQPQARRILVGETVKTVAWKSLGKERFKRIFGDHEAERISRRAKKCHWFKPGNLRRAWSDDRIRRVAGGNREVVEVRKSMEEEELKIRDTRLSGVWWEERGIKIRYRR